MCDQCGCGGKLEKPVVYKCDCDGCECDGIVGFDSEPEAVPYCCDKPMKRVK